MHKHLGKLIGIGIIVALVSVIFILNGHPVQVTPWFGAQMEISAALLILICFIAGGALTSLVGVFLGIRSSWRERGLKKKLATHNKHWEQIVKGRELLASGELKKAIGILKKIIEKDPDNIVARIELAEAYAATGDHQSALTTLDNARQAQRDNVELLFLAAKMNQELGNPTAAYDNLALVVKAQPTNEYALESLVSLSRQLGKLEDARLYQEELIRVREVRKEQDEQTRVDIAIEIAEHHHKDDPQALLQELERIAKRNKHYGPALARYAQTLASQGNNDAATKFYTKAFRASLDACYLEDIAELWLSQDEPNRCLSALQAALNAVDHGPETHVMGHLVLASVFLTLENIDAAELELTALENRSIDKNAATITDLLRARIAQRRGRLGEGLLALTRVIEEGSLPENSRFASNLLPSPEEQEQLKIEYSKAPSPELSTP